jgi:hypothetical protein
VSLSLPLRPWLLLAATLLWLWASSVFTPWAEDRAPRLWLYDLLFYLRFALLFWAVAEILHLAWRRKSRASMPQALPMVAIVVLVLAAWTYERTEAGRRWKVSASRGALTAVARDGYNDRRRRAGHFLVDTTRIPCRDAQPWLWLGRPHGGGTGINLALVHSGNRVPDAPVPDAFAFSPVADGWWMAYQHAGRYRRTMQQRSASLATAKCVTGAVVTHRQGMAFIKAGH